jgi:hypothetical protein
MKASRQTLEKVLRDGNADKQWLQILAALANGKCRCGARLDVVAVEKSGSGVRRILRCGDTYTAISLDGVVNVGEGFEASSLGTTPEGAQDTSARIGGTQSSKEAREITVVKLLCHYFKPHFSEFSNDIQNSPVDVIAKSPQGEIEYFQVTKLYEQSFWREIATKKSIERVTADVSGLVEDAIVRKQYFDQNTKHRIILVIDAWPGVMRALVEKTMKLPILSSSGFKEIWMMGSVPELSFQLFPTGDIAQQTIT